MGARHSSERNSERRTRNIEQCVETDSYCRLRRELLGSTREQRRALFRTGNLPRYIHGVIFHKNARMLQFLVQHCDVPLEERDEHGLTPLYSTLYKGWETGALILLRGGADVRNADSGPNTHGCTFTPVLHLAVRRGSKRLVEELVKRGADINVKDSAGNDWLSLLYLKPQLKVIKFMWQKACESESSAGETPYDLGNSDMHEFIVSVFIFNDAPSAKRLIKSRHLCEQRKFWQLLGAWYGAKGDYKRALSCWRKETNTRCWLHDLNIEEETGRKSTFADILNVDVDQLLHGLHLSDEKAESIMIRSLLVLESHVPQLPEFMTALRQVSIFLVEDKPASTIRLLSRLTAIRNPRHNEIPRLVGVLILALHKLKVSSELSCSILLEFMATASKYLWVLTRTGSFSTDNSSKTAHDDLSRTGIPCRLCVAVTLLRNVYLEAMDSFCEMEVPAIPEQLQSYNSHAKDFVSSFPWIFGDSLFHVLGSSTSFSCSPSVMRTLVVCSAEVKGQLRLENCPPHLAANGHGDTPLHLFAQHMSQEDLLDNGILECFLKHGADLCTRNRRGQSVRDILVERGILSAGELLPSLLCAAAAAFMRDPQLRGKVDQCGVAAFKHFLLDHSDW